MITEEEVRDIEAKPTNEISQENFWNLHKAASINYMRNPMAALKFAKKAHKIAKILNSQAELAQAFLSWVIRLERLGMARKQFLGLTKLSKPLISWKTMPTWQEPRVLWLDIIQT